MSKKARIEFYGAVYHIIQRGQFNKEADKMKIIQIIGEVKAIFDFNLFAYCILDDGFHLVVKTHNIPISQIIHRIKTRYAKSYNKNYNRTGSPFIGRYRSIIVKDEYSILNLINYIHNIPIYIGVVQGIEEYKWSSDFFYRINLESIVDIQYILNNLSPERDKSIDIYKEEMKTSDVNYKILKQRYEKKDFIGEDRRICLNEILKSVCKNAKYYDLIKSASRKSYLIPYKFEYIKKSRELGYSNLEIGENIGIGERAVSKYLKLSEY